jgi:hypothetical protein
VAQHEVRAGVDDAAGEGAQVAALFAVEGLHRVGHVECVGAFGPAVEGNERHVRPAGERIDEGRRRVVVVEVIAAATGVEGHQSYAPVLAP